RGGAARLDHARRHGRLRRHRRRGCVGSVIAHLTGQPSPLGPLHDGIVWQLRLPRILTAAAVGAGLALVGCVMQAVTRNQLADPYLLGLSSGASLGAVAVLVLGVGL